MKNLFTSIQFVLGQDALFKVSKAYAVYDSEVGYCQGLSFIAASLLLHVSFLHLRLCSKTTTLLFLKSFLIDARRRRLLCFSFSHVRLRFA